MKTNTYTRIVLKENASQKTIEAILEAEPTIVEGERNYVFKNRQISTIAYQNVVNIYYNTYWVSLPLNEVIAVANWPKEE